MKLFSPRPFPYAVAVCCLLTCHTAGAAEPESPASTSGIGNIRIGATTRKKEDVKEYPSLKPLFESVLDQYPCDVRLFERPEFVERLTDLVGPLRVEYMRKNFEYEYPIERITYSYSVMACKSGMCGITDFEIQYFPERNNLCVKYMIDGKQEVFMEKETSVRWTEYSDEEE